MDKPLTPRFLHVDKQKPSPPALCAWLEDAPFDDQRVKSGHYGFEGDMGAKKEIVVQDVFVVVTVDRKPPT